MDEDQDTVWEHFLRESSGRQGKKKDLNTCLFCYKTVKHAHVSRAVSHLKGCNKITRQAAADLVANGWLIKTKKKSPTTIVTMFKKASTAHDLTAIESEEMEELLCDIVFKDGNTLSHLDKPGLRRLINRLLPSYKIPSRTQLSTKLLDSYYYRYKTELNVLIQSAQNISILTDGWCNPNNQHITNYLLQIDERPFFFRAVVGTERAQDAAETAAGIQSIIDEVGQDKIIGLTTDNASVMLAAGEIVRRTHPEFIHIGCFAHRFHLIANSIIAIPELQSVYDKAVTLTLYFKRHTGPLERVKQHAAVATNKFLAFVVAGNTRWQGKMHCLKAVLNNWTAMRATIMDLRIENVKTDDELRPLRDILDDPCARQQLDDLYSLLSPLLQLTIAVEKDSPSLADAYAYSSILLNHPWKTNLVSTAEIKAKVTHHLDKAYHPLMPLAYLCSPRLHEKHQTKVSESQINQLCSWITTHCRQEDLIDDGWFYAEMSKLQSGEGKWVRETPRWRSYVNNTPHSWLNSYVKDVDHRFIKLCQKAVSLTATTGAAERNWSLFGRIHSRSRSRLDPDRAEKLVFVYNALNGGVSQESTETQQHLFAVLAQEVLEAADAV